jgi:hypothetical protein
MDTETALTIALSVTTTLFYISELLTFSNCKPNGILQAILIYGSFLWCCCCVIRNAEEEEATV